MKKVLLASLYLMASVFMLTACSDDDDDNNASEMPQEGEVEFFDELSFLQNSIVEIDSTGAKMGVSCGKALDEMAPTELYVGAENIEEAKEIFLSWIINKESVISTGNNITVSLKSEERNDQGKVYFTAKEQGSMVGEYPLIAEVTFDTDIKYVSKVYFINKSSWPNNAGSQYFVGDIVNLHSSGREGWKNYVCIREYSAGVKGMLISMSDKSYDGYNGIFWTATETEAKQASEIIRKDWNTFKVFFEDAGLRLNDDYLFYFALKKFWGVQIGTYAINLHTGGIDWYGLTKERRHLFCYFFDDDGEVED